MTNFSIEYGDTQTLPFSYLAKEINTLGKQAYGTETAFSIEMLISWLEACPQGFYLLRKEEILAGYLYAMPISSKEYQASLKPEYDERTLFLNDLGSATIEKPYNHYLISSLVVAPHFQEKTPASLLLRLAFLQRTIEWCNPLKPVYFSAQALSEKGERCAQSLMMKKCGITTNDWIIYSASLSNENLLSIELMLKDKIKERVTAL